MIAILHLFRWKRNESIVSQIMLHEKDINSWTSGKKFDF